jgi:hypothetical protein
MREITMRAFGADADGLDQPTAEQHYGHKDGRSKPLTEQLTGYLHRYRYTAREYEADTALQYSRIRHCDPGVGRWLADQSGS